MNIQSILILLGVVCFAGMAVAAMVRRRKDSDPCKGCINSGACSGGCFESKQPYKHILKDYEEVFFTADVYAHGKYGNSTGTDKRE